MINDLPIISIITPFYNTPPAFLAEAIESVLAQQYPHWELLLIDDGSDQTDGRELAQSYVARYPEQIQLHQHPDNLNRGISASRQVGLQLARGRYVAFLDADDVYMPHKLVEQLGLLQSQPTAVMLYGMTRYWTSWTGLPQDIGRDFTPVPGIMADRLYAPPTLLTYFLQGKTAVPCMGSLLVQRERLLQLGGFEAQFTGMYEDQVFYAKICLDAPVYVATACWDWYRQHPDSVTGLASRSGQMANARRQYLQWLQNYLGQIACQDQSVWRAVQQERWLLNSPHWLPERAHPYSRWLKKWLLRAGLVRKGLLTDE